MSKSAKQLRCRTQILEEACTFEWSIEKFSKICSMKTKAKKKLVGPTFTTGKSPFETEWCISLNFNENADIGIFLKRISNLAFDHYVLHVISIIGSDKIKYHTKRGEDLFTDSSNNWGYKNFIKRTKLFEEEQLLLLPNDTLTIICELQLSVSDASIFSDLTEESKTLHPSSDLVFQNPDLLIEDLQLLYDSKVCSDFTIKVGEEELKVHKLILCARSSVFNTMLNTDMKENLTNCLEITDFDPLVIEALFRYIYTGQVEDLNPGKSIQLYSAAEKYNLQDLKDACAKYLSNNLNIDNICEVLVLGELHEDALLKTAARNFICMNAADIQETDQWLGFSKKMPDLVLAVNRLVISQTKKK